MLKQAADLGDCFRMAGKYVMDNKDCVLTHASVRNSGDKKRFPHAWAEKDGKVYDPTLDAWFNKELYYQMFNVEDVKQYSSEQAVISMVRNRHWGPW